MGEFEEEEEKDEEDGEMNLDEATEDLGKAFAVTLKFRL